MSKHHWHILGAGAIGCLYAEALHRAGCQTTLLLRSGGPGQQALVVEREESRCETPLPIASPENCGGISHLLVTTKAYDVGSAVQSIAHHLGADSTALVLVNGMGLAAQLQRDFPQLDIFSGTTTEGAYRIAPLHIRHAGHGETRIGRKGQEQPAPWFHSWSGALGNCVWDSDIDAALWEKMAVNCVINPLTAIYRCRNGDLAQRPELARQVDSVCTEITQVSYAAGFTSTAQTLQQTVARVIAGTAANRSSMLQDVSAGRRTEIDYITGYLLQVARDHGIVAPHNTDLFERVKNIAD